MGESLVHEVDPWRFAGRFLENVLSGAVPESDFADDIPFTPVRKPLDRCKVALLSTAGISMRDDEPFDMEFERQHPTRGDASWRRLRRDATAESIVANHLHIDTGYIERDLNVALPLDRLRELVDQGVVGAVAKTHYSIMGYQGNDSSRLVQQSAPEIAQSMVSEEVDLALLAPVCPDCFRSVGLVSRVIEARGIPTVTLNMIWVYQRLVGMPRVAAIEHPFGRPYADVGDVETQTAVLRAALDVFAKAQQPGHIEHLPFVWHEEPKQTKWHPAEPSPIISLIKKRRAR